MLQQLEAPLVAPSDVARRTDPYGPIRAAVDRLLGEFVDDRLAELAAVDPALVAIATHLRTLVAGGKRLRPAFVLLGVPRRRTRRRPLVVPVAAAVELLHTFALLHDDVMDQPGVARPADRPAGVRRRAPPRADSAATPSGSASAPRSSPATSPSCGPTSSSMPRQLRRRGRAARGERFTALRTEVIAGQYLDLRLDRRPSVTEDEAPARRPAQVGALHRHPPAAARCLALAGDAGRGAAALRDYGDAVGLAFQLRDDVLGLFGDATAPARTVLDDLREGKRTVLVLRALALATPASAPSSSASSATPVVERPRRRALPRGHRRLRCAGVGRGASSTRTIAGRSTPSDGLAEPARSALRALADDLARRDR